MKDGAHAASLGRARFRLALHVERHVAETGRPGRASRGLRAGGRRYSDRSDGDRRCDEQRRTPAVLVEMVEHD